MLPTSLYIHVPWCIRKCPYCDFNSHKSPDSLPEEDYVRALIDDLKADIARHQRTLLQSIFIGGGTPSLLSGQAYDRLLTEVNQLLDFSPDIEITLEANPGTVEQQRFKAYRQAGINRLSLGIQSFNPTHLKRLGRIHDDAQAHRAIDSARAAGFDNMNLDIMHSLPEQTLQEGLDDLRTAISHQPQHISWYQLTLEPNTVFYKQQPPLPSDEFTADLEDQGFAMLAEHGFKRYEISAFSQPGKASRHNLNYWLFGDYFGIGAGAHGKLTSADHQVLRTRKYRQPKDYLNPDHAFLAAGERIDEASLLFEFMLNATRLEQKIPRSLFKERTGLSDEGLTARLQQAAEKGLIDLQKNDWQVTERGRRYTNNLQALFLPED
ncbi:oxygen-independent coproporphyrinogen III oxidase [Legionella rubrilucens]|uniref:Heme chaperone HemW n=1 Tax=Legionella rubrilucens TaxID=458 RepID=A0A0W0XUM2_9GAMM|nr:radical SAM family heme chaperone HemW [Legionella rubrilucens]KTD48471.1 oxygen-independent coproporphyrinogen III oxidase [Legionella rubrilucens]